MVCMYLFHSRHGNSHHGNSIQEGCMGYLLSVITADHAIYYVCMDHLVLLCQCVRLSMKDV